MQLGWIDRQAEREAKRERLRGSERISSLFGVFVSIVVIIYFYGHYSGNTGFFTSSFTSADAVLFFGASVLGLLPQLTRSVLGRRNVTRLLEVLTEAVFLIASIWFLATFPFDMSHLADLLPNGWHFLLTWISADLVKVVLVIAIAAMLFVIPYTLLLYQAVKRKLRAQTA